MDSSSKEVVLDFSPMIKVYKDGHIERLSGSDIVPPSFDPTTKVESKDILISKDQNISARIYIPKPNNDEWVARMGPEHPLPIAYEDSWISLEWVASHLHENGCDEWINRYADFEKVFFAGDSAGANIAHNMAIRVGTEGLQGINVEGIVLVHAFFWGVERVGSEAEKPEQLCYVDNLWRFVCPTSSGSDDPLLNSGKDKNLGRLGCKRVLVCVAENDLLKDRGWYYKELLEKSDYGGVVDVIETKGEGHVFHLFNPKSDNTLSLLKQIVSFMVTTSVSREEL